MDTGFIPQDKMALIAPPRAKRLLTLPPRSRFFSKSTRTILVVPYSWQIPLSDLTQSQLKTNQIFFDSLYSTLIKISASVEDVHLIIKTKRADNMSLRTQVSSAAELNGLEIQSLPNVRFEGKASFHEVLEISDIVIGLNSSALLEANVSGIYTLLPIFSYLRPIFDDLIWFLDDVEYFDVADSAAVLEETVHRFLNNPSFPDSEDMYARRHLFQKYFNVEGEPIKELGEFLWANLEENK